VVADRMRRAKEQSEELRHTRGELDQMTMILEDMGGQLQGEKEDHDNLKFSHAQTLSELDEFKRQIHCQSEAHASEVVKWKENWGKVANEKNDILVRLQLAEEDKKGMMTRVAQLERKLELESANKNSIRIRELEGLHLNEIRRLEKVLNRKPTAHKSSQTETDNERVRDAALLQARLVSYKSCFLHMQNEIRLLEVEYGKLKPLDDEGVESGPVMDRSNDENENTTSTADIIGSSVDSIIEESSTSTSGHDDIDGLELEEESKVVAMSVDDGGGDCENVNNNAQREEKESCQTPDILTEAELFEAEAAQSHWAIAMYDFD